MRFDIYLDYRFKLLLQAYAQVVVAYARRYQVEETRLIEICKI
jgi:hypothetical protein